MVSIKKMIILSVASGVVVLLAINFSGIRASETFSEKIYTDPAPENTTTNLNLDSAPLSLTGCKLKSLKELVKFILVFGAVNKSLEKLRVSEFLDKQQRFSFSDLLCRRPPPRREVVQE